MRWNPIFLILLLLPGCTTDPAPQPQPTNEAIEAQRGAVPDHRGSWQVAGSCTLWWAAERLELQCQDRVPLLADLLVGQPAVNAGGSRIAVSHRPGDVPTARIEVIEFADGRWGEPRVLVDGEGRPDRVAIDADGGRVVYVDAAGGIAALWLVPFAGGDPLQLTNAGLGGAAREPGQPPAGFVPLPLRDPPLFEGNRLTWTSAAGPHELELP